MILSLCMEAKINKKWRQCFSFARSVFSYLRSKQGISFVFILLLFISTFIKVYLASLGHGFDVGSWKGVSQVVLDGDVVYAKYKYYNYGPVWALILGPVGYLSEKLPLSGSEENFHMWVALSLSLVDIAMAVTLRAVGYSKAGFLFLLNPVTWFVSGFVSQFDQIAIYIGFLAVLAFSQAENPGRGRRAFFAGAVLLLAGSLATKHILAIFPAWLGFWWLARNKRGYPAALLLVFLPSGLFFLSFLPYWSDPAARAGIIQNVFHFQSNYLHSLIPQILGLMGFLRPIEEGLSGIPFFSGYKFLWLLMLLGIGWKCRRKTVLDLYLIYLIAFLALGPAVYGQYLVIPVISCAFLWHFWEARVYTLASTLYLLYYSARKMTFIYELPWAEKMGVLYVFEHYYDDFPKYFPLVFLLPLLWKVLGEKLPDGQ